jgi:hypothetical protein
MFRFTIRELVLVTIIVAMGVGWLLDNRRLRRDVSQANEKAFAYLMELTRIAPPPALPPNSK